ncbi:caspase family protein [Bradyrhizobium liaoningense]|uniref:caspase family protein n=1 Tax=Bradyrhizobium liaoningense TaxID=43992 RepID=UPI001BAA7411|nr:caspase family protein [Bradyrhizobium liaoningense]MBR0717650.1 caspase family protein [Bradyrhizobium liaoningense]
MLRVVSLSLFILLSYVPFASAEPQLGDDLTTCRDRQLDLQVRAQACETLLNTDRVTGKDKAVALTVRGNTFINKRDLDRAIEVLSEAVDLDPDNVITLNLRGLAHERKGQDDLAMADYNLALQKRPTYGVPYNNRGIIQVRRGALQSALDDFNLSIKYAPRFLLGYTNRARVRTLLKDYDGALADFAEAEKIEPNAQQITANRCTTYALMGKFDLALADCNGLIQKMPKWQYALSNRGDVYLLKGDVEAALRDYNAVLQLNPNNVRAYAGRGQVYERKRDLAQARADYRSAAYALTPFDDYDVARARAKAQERLAALAPQGPGASSTTRRVALVIGNGAYRNVHPLDNPPRDAKLIAGVLRDVGFQTVVATTDLTRDKFFETLQTFAKEAEKADWAVVYYAGHGFEIGGVNYLVPIDAKLAADKDAESQAVALEQVIAAVGAARKLRLVILDACRDNPFAPTMQRTLSLKLVDKGFSNIEPGAGFMVVYAAKHGETALDGDGGADNSPFAVAFAREMKEPRVEVRKLFDIIRDDVWAATKHGQQPFTYGSPPGREDFYFVAGK